MLEKRVEQLEKEVAELKRQAQPDTKEATFVSAGPALDAKEDLSVLSHHIYPLLRVNSFNRHA